MRTFVSRHWPLIASVIVFGSLIAGEALRIRPFEDIGAGMNLLDFGIGAVTLIQLVRLAIVGRTRQFVRFVREHPVWRWSVLFLAWAAATLAFNAPAYGPGEIVVAGAYLARLAAVLLLTWTVAFEAKRFRLPVQEWFLAASAGLVGIGFLVLLLFPNFRFMKAEGWDPHISRMLSSFYDPNLFGLFLVLVMAVSVGFYLARRNRRVRWSYLLLFGVSWAALFLAYSRSAWVAGLVAIPVIFWRANRLAAIAIATIFIVSLLVPTRLGERFETTPSLVDTSRYSSEGFECKKRTDPECDPTGATRINNIRQGIELTARNPIVGVGYNAYGFAMVDEALARERTLRKHAGQGSDSSLLNVWATTGVIGLALFLMFYSRILLALLRAARVRGETGWMAYALLAFGIALLAASFFNNALFYMHILVPWLLLVAVTLPAARSRR
ncbi:MAG: O-antigen ligase family protein [bacterium]|nr:O-antigen ligase family protein [bacterium]